MADRTWVMLEPIEDPLRAWADACDALALARRTVDAAAVNPEAAQRFHSHTRHTEVHGRKLIQRALDLPASIMTRHG